jgi:hypothetical protein
MGDQLMGHHSDYHGVLINTDTSMSCSRFKHWTLGVKNLNIMAIVTEFVTTVQFKYKVISENFATLVDSLVNRFTHKHFPP